MFVLLNFTAIAAAAGSVPVFHVWCTNWNPFFFLTYVLVMFAPERFVVKVDDDHILIDRNGFANYIGVATRHNAIVGLGAWEIGSPECGLRVAVGPPSGHADHVAALVLFAPIAARIVHRFRWATYVGSEDIALGTANSLECQTKSMQVKFEVKDIGGDGMSSQFDQEIIQELKKYQVWVFVLQYCHAIFGGFRPARWRPFHLPKPIDIRLPH
jgi:hypothetical protein